MENYIVILEDDYETIVNRFKKEDEAKKYFVSKLLNGEKVTFARILDIEIDIKVK